MPFEFVTLDDDFRPVRRVCWPGDEYDRETLPFDPFDDADAGIDCGPAGPVSAADVLDDPDLLPF